MAQIKVIYKNADGYDQEHSEAADSVKMQSFKTANYELTDQALGHLIGGGDAADLVHNHDGLYFRETEFINVSTGVSDADKPIKSNASGKVDNTFLDVSGLNPVLDHGLLAGLGDDDHTQYLLASGARDISGVIKYASQPVFADEKELVSKKYVDDLVSGVEVESVLAAQATPPGAPTAGAKYLVTATATGDWLGKENYVATWTGSAWQFRAPITGLKVYADNEPTLFYLYTGTAFVQKFYENTTASTGLTKVGADIQVDPTIAGAALGFASGILDVKVAAAGGLEIVSDELKVKALGIKDTMIDFGTGAGQVSAADMPISDAGGLIAATNVETALQELAANISAAGVEYTAGVGGIVKGDPVYISDIDVVSKYTTLTNTARIVGIALNNALAGQPVKVLANDTVCPGVLTGGVAGATYYWNGTAYSLTIPSGGGSHCWALGRGKNVTDLHVEIEFIKKNA